MRQIALYFLIVAGLTALISAPMISIGAMHAIPFSILFAGWGATFYSIPRSLGSALQALVGAIAGIVGLWAMMANNPCMMAKVATPICTVLQMAWAGWTMYEYRKHRRS